MTLAAHETRAPVTKNITKSLFGSWLYLTLCAIFLTLFNVLIPPGTGIMAKSLYPMVDGFAAFFNLDKDKGKLHLIFYEYPSQIFNLLAMLWCVSRQTWALSRGIFV